MPCISLVEANEKPVYSGMTLRTLLGGRRRRKDDRRKRFFSVIATQQGPKVRTEGVRPLRFLAFLSLTNRKINHQSECCLGRCDFFFNRKLVMSFSEADCMELDSTSSSVRKWASLQGSFRKGKWFDWRSIAICRFVMTWIKFSCHSD